MYYIGYLRTDVDSAMWKPTFVVVLNGIFFYSQRNLKSKSLTLNALQFFFIILFQWPHPLPKQSLVDLFYTPSHPPPDFAHTPLPKLLSLLMQYPRSATPFSTRNFLFGHNLVETLKAKAAHTFSLICAPLFCCSAMAPATSQRAELARVFDSFVSQSGAIKDIWFAHITHFFVLPFLSDSVSFSLRLIILSREW